MDFSKIKSIIIPEGAVSKIVAGSNIIWEKVKEVVTIINWLPRATATDRTTIFGGDYNGDGKNDGYLTGKRLSSSGSESTMTGMCCSGFIPAKPGDILRIKNIAPKTSTASYVISYNSSNAKVAHITLASSGEKWGTSTLYTLEDGLFTIPLTTSNFGTGFDAVRFSAGVINADTIVTVNQEIV